MVTDNPDDCQGLSYRVGIFLNCGRWLSMEDIMKVLIVDDMKLSTEFVYFVHQRTNSPD